MIHYHGEETIKISLERIKLQLKFHHFVESIKLNWIELFRNFIFGVKKKKKKISFYFFLEFLQGGKRNKNEDV